MAGISQHCKTGDVVAFGESVGVASKALCGLTEAAGQVRSRDGTNSLGATMLLRSSLHLLYFDKYNICVELLMLYFN